jgi:outer membrane receptor protein involved in Fe transport
MSVLSAEKLAAAGLNDIAEVAGREPTLALQQSVSATTTSLRIRRIGALGNITTFEPAVGLYVDGAFRTRSLLAAGDFIDIERIEILRGPQSTLYGKNASAGVVALYTSPPAEQFEGSAEATTGSIDTDSSPSLTNLKLRVSGPLTPAVRASMAATHSSHGSTTTNAIANGPDGNDGDRLAVRGQLAWSPLDALDLRLLMGHSREQDTQGESDVFLAPGSPSATVANVMRQDGLAAECTDNQPHNRRTCSVAVNTLDLDTSDLTLLGNYRLSNGWTLTSVTGWDHYRAQRTDNDIAQLSAPVLFFADDEQGSSIQQELRLSSTDRPTGGAVASWLAGVFYYRHDYERGGDGDQPMFGPNGAGAYHPIWSALLRGVPLALPGQMGIHQSHLDTRYLSAFGDVVWRLTDHWSFITAVRWQREEKQAAIHNSLTLPGASLVSTTLTPTVSPTGEAVNGSIARRSDDVTWSATSQYHFSDALMSYFTVASGAKSGGFNTGFGNAPLTAREFGDERIRHHELGARATFADGRARLSAATFYTEYHDYQDAAFVAAQFSVGNAERVVLQGAELEGAVLIGRVTTDFAISAADLKYATNTTGACYPGRTPDGTAPRSCDLSGERPINAPVWVTHVGLQYDQPSRWGETYVRIDWTWTDDYRTSFSADPRLVQNNYSDLAVRVGTQVADTCEVVLWVDNLLGESIASIDSLLNLFSDRSYQSYMAEPRRFGATVRMHF